MATTDTVYRSAKPRADLYEIQDSEVRGLALRVHPTGSKSWSTRLSIRGAGRVRRDLGAYPSIGVAQARRIAEDWRNQARRGIDPRDEFIRPSKLTLKAAADLWLSASTNRSADQCRRRLELHVLGFEKIGDLDVRDIEQRHVARLLTHLKTKKRLTAEVNRVRSTLSALYSWLVTQGEVQENPVARTARVEETSIRKAKEGNSRVLNVTEIVRIWRSAEQLQPIPRALIRLLILVPLRRQEWTEVNRAEVIEIDGYTCLSLPASRMKGRRPHLVPLPQQAVEILEAMPQLGDMIFSTDGVRPYAGWRSAAKAARVSAELDEPWCVHDLRRGVATGMGELGIPENVIARILAHSPMRLMGVTAVYDRSQRLRELSNALNRWAVFIEQEVLGRRNVVSLPLGQIQ
ncbi:tyrosine-type recombinase/integrase [Nisaea sediminum]|uniref:tyrosine-type recombinase/integrase n=1 Tax=Nisaea sediminum TaxID=2775867 RepID=UPI0018682532|nr:integrase arm-type DNA-binding domain-containing protein [Nisaea sediminum]